MPRVQQQVVPLSYGVDLKPPSAAPPAPPAGGDGSGDGSTNDGGGDGADQSNKLADFRAGYESERLAA
jgi:hypothetical protein